MAVDYNLVILGGSLAARHAAIRAAEWGARVALVEPPWSTADHGATWEREQLQLAHLQAIAGVPEAQAGQRAARLGQASAFAAWQFEQSSPAVLAAQGVDVVLGAGGFIHRPTLGVQVGDRVLQGHHYLIAVSSMPQPPSQPSEPSLQGGLTSLQQLLTDQTRDQIRAVAVQGAAPQDIVLAQVLQRLGLSVVLATPAVRLLPQEDQAIADLVQAHLEAAGVQVVTAATCRQNPGRKTAGGVEVQSGPLILRADAAIASERYQPRLSDLNLPGEVTVTTRGLSVNARLQTGHPRLYACGYALDPVSPHDVAIAEARVAVDNALSLPYRRVPYSKIPRVIAADPPVVRVGLTAAQARKTHKDIVVLQQDLAPLRQAQLHRTPSGLCRVVVSKRGRILGACAAGPAASDWIGVLSEAIARRTPLQALDVSWPSSAYGEVISMLVGQWRRQRRRWLLDKAELLLSWRRDWTR